MNRNRLLPRLVLALLTALAVTGFGRLPRATGQQDPATAKDVFSSAPFDRITLIDNVVVDVEPITPRPLPPFDPRKLRSLSTTPARPEENFFLPSQKDKIEALAKTKRAEEELNLVLTVKLLDRDGLFYVRRPSIKGVEYYEDLLLAEGDEYVRKRDFTRAFERYMAVRQRDPNWKGIDERVQRLWFEEGAAALRSDDLESGLRILRELNAQRPDYPGLADALGKVFTGRIERSFESGAYAEGRRVLHDLEQLSPEHSVVRQARGRYIAKAQALVDQAAKRTGTEQLDALADALRVWPSLGGATERYAAAFEAEPTLDVGVLDLARALGPWTRSPAESRVVPLVYLPLLAGEDEDASTGRRTDQLAAALETADLGRRLTISLRDGLVWSDGARPITVLDVVRSLSDRANPFTPRYEARWASLVQRIEPTGERQVVVTLLRSPLKPASWLVEPIGPAEAGSDGRSVTSDGSLQTLGSGPFRVAQQSETSAVFVASSPDRRGVRRIREIRYPDAGAAVTALRRGDVTLIENVPPLQVAALKNEPGIQVGHYARPRVHVLALDGRSPALRNRTLRRGLSYAIDRRTILEDVLLRRPPDDINAPADGAFPRESYANAPDVLPLESDPVRARILVTAGRKELGGMPIKLTLDYPAIPEAQAAVQKIVEALRDAGLEIEARERPESILEASLRSGRRFDLAYRALTTVEPITDAGPVLCPGYDAPPSADGLGAIASPRIAQVLLQLEKATDIATARGLVIQLDREVRDELPIIPLWQLRDHYAWRSRLTGPGATSEHLYQGIDQWTIAPWFARDPW